VIIRKPYALLIKNFRFIHLILTVLIGYLFYVTSPFSNLFNLAVKNQIVHYGRDLVGEFFSPNIYLAIIAIVLISILVMWLMIAKKKPYLVYLYNTIAYMVLFVLLFITQQYFQEISNNLVDVIILGNLRDFLAISMLVQVIAFVFAFIRSTGFDIKKFNFAEDLEDLDINEEDREEVELQIEFDWDKYVAKIKRRLRHIRYFYVENRFISNLSLLVVILATSLYTYAAMTLFNRNFYQTDVLVVGEVDAIVNKSYVTTKDYRNNIILKDSKLIIASVSLKSIKERTIDLKTIYLTIGSNRYTPVRNYDEYVKDLGKSYNQENLNKDYTNYILVYKVDKDNDINKAVITFTDYIFDNTKNFTKQLNVKLNPINLDKSDIVTTNLLNEEITIENNPSIKDGKLLIQSISVDEYLDLPYRFCLNTTTCYDSIEVLRPKLNSYEKSILTINGEFDYDISDFIKDYGVIEYEAKTGTKTTREVVELLPIKIRKKNTYYFEIPKESSKIIKIIFTIRNYKYEYTM
jgi:hypothetical protein